MVRLLQDTEKIVCIGEAARTRETWTGDELLLVLRMSPGISFPVWETLCDLCFGIHSRLSLLFKLAGIKRVFENQKSFATNMKRDCAITHCKERCGVVISKALRVCAAGL